MKGQVEKIGTVEILPIRTHARALYLPLGRDLVETFELKLGDKLKVKIVEVHRAVETEGE